MKITGIEAHVLVGKLEGKPFGCPSASRAPARRRSASSPRTRASRGVGEAFYFGGPVTVAATLMRDGFGPLLVGCDPMDTSVIWDRLYNWTRDQGQRVYDFGTERHRHRALGHQGAGASCSSLHAPRRSVPEAGASVRHGPV